MTTPSVSVSDEKRNAVPSFPQYAPPNPQGIPVADPKYHSPLYKLAKMMLKPKGKVRGKKTGQTVHVTKRKQKWY